MQKMDMSKNTNETGQEEVYHTELQEAVASDSSASKTDFNKLLRVG